MLGVRVVYFYIFIPAYSPRSYRLSTFFLQKNAHLKWFERDKKIFF